MEGDRLQAGERDEGGIGAGAPGDQLATAAVGPLAVAGGNRRRWRDDSGPGSGPVADDLLQPARPGRSLADCDDERCRRDDHLQRRQTEALRSGPDVADGNGVGRGQGARTAPPGRPQPAQRGEDVADGYGHPGSLHLRQREPRYPQSETDGAARTFPTPSASDAKGFDGPGKAHPSKNWAAYSHLVRMTLNHGHECSPKCRRLNPLFVAWLMGWPGGWTLLPNELTDSESLATAWFRWSRLMRYSLSRLGH